ncbi:hypothetical protein LJB77_02800 [Ruminococcaceae bacterium OttesenSCG-928-N02]|nr:hypothetical protein [Ruminococcaceae bacterium OttesenSCG-928-N02]
MNIELLIQDSKTCTVWDISEVTTTIKYTTYLEGNPGKLEISMIEDPAKMFGEGSNVRFKLDGVGVFFGYVFTRERSNTGKLSLTCYDQLRYLKNKDTAVFTGLTATQMFERICSAQQFEHRVTTATSYALPPKVYDNKSYYEMLQDGMDLTLVNAGQWVLMRDNFGVLEMGTIEDRATTFVIGDAEQLTGYTFKSSIDSDTYNRIKLSQEVTSEDGETKQRQVYVVYDSETEAHWGTLQYYDKVDENANAAQIRQRAEILLELKNRPTHTIKLTCMGNIAITAGSSVYVDIAALDNEDTQNRKFALVNECTHTISNDKHTMVLGIEVV